jgi:hypothetical protein
MRRLLIVFLIVFIIITSLGVLLKNQRDLFREAELVQAMGRPLMAVSLYERVILNYVPFSPYNKKAIERMENLCKNLNDKKYKLFCEETLRSSLYQTRSFYFPYNEKIKETEKRILLLKTELYIEHNNPPEKDYERIYKDLKTMMEYDWYPSVFWSLIATVSLILWILCITFTIWKGFSKQINKRILISGTAGFILFFTLWLIGLYIA